MRRLALAFLLAGLVAAAVLVLHAQGRRGLALEERRLADEARAARRASLEAVRGDVARALGSLLAREAARPYDHYRSLFVPADAVSVQMAFVPSPLAGEPQEPLVSYYFEYRGGVFSSPAIPPDPEPDAYARRVSGELATLKDLEPLLRARLSEPEPAPVAEDVVDGLIADANANLEQRLEGIKQACDVPGPSREKLALEWQGYQKSRAGRSQTKNASQGAAQKVPTGRDGVPLRLFPLRWLRRGADENGWPRLLLAVRKVELGPESRLQGFAVDPARVRERVLPEAIEHAAPLSSVEERGTFSFRSGPERARPLVTVVPAASARGEALALLPPLEGLALALADDAPSPRGALEKGRLLLDGALVLALAVVLVGGAILLHAAESERRLAHRRADFVAALTHELKAPLTGFRAMTELLADGVVSDEAKRAEYYRTMLSECDRLSRLVQNVLATAKLERGAALPLAPESLDALSLLRERASAFAPRLESAGFRFEVELDDELPRVRADREAVSQVLGNLLDNAVKYGHGREKTVRLEATHDDRAIHVRVSDRGPGVPARERERVFERFYRSPSAPREVGGAGLGLAIARAQARGMGGDVVLEEREGGGACFRFSLPRDRTS